MSRVVRGGREVALAHLRETNVYLRCIHSLELLCWSVLGCLG